MTGIERLEKLAEPADGTGVGTLYVEKRRAQMWECGQCGFSFLADHKDEDTEGYSCPNCFEEHIRKLLPDLVKLVRAAAEEHLGRPCRDMRCQVCLALQELWREGSSGEPHEQREGEDG